MKSEIGSDGAEAFAAEQAAKAARTASEAIDGLDEQVRTLMREHPLLALAGGVAAGFVVGRLVSRPRG